LYLLAFLKSHLIFTTFDRHTYYTSRQWQTTLRQNGSPSLSTIGFFDAESHPIALFFHRLIPVHATSILLVNTSFGATKGAIVFSNAQSHG
jgi:hypothetical protein